MSWLCHQPLQLAGLACLLVHCAQCVTDVCQGLPPLLGGPHDCACVHQNVPFSPLGARDGVQPADLSAKSKPKTKRVEARKSSKITANQAHRRAQDGSTPDMFLVQKRCRSKTGGRHAIAMAGWNDGRVQQRGPCMAHLADVRWHRLGLRECKRRHRPASALALSLHQSHPPPAAGRVHTHAARE